MTTYRGPGDSANSGQSVTALADQAAASATAAQVAQAASETAQTASETAQTAAETAQTAAETAQTAAETALDSFDDRYLGAKASDPTLDNDGNALITGALYFNTTSGKMMVYGGAAWVPSSVQGINSNADATAITIDSSENVGIGTTSPGTKLQINKDSTSGGVGGLVIKSADSNESLLSVGVSTSLGRAFIASLSNGAGTAQPLDFITGTSSTNVRMRIDSAGNVGIGVVPEAWNSTFHALQVGGLGSIFATASQAAGSATDIGSNVYYDGAWKYIVTDEASRYRQDSGTHQFFTAPSGTADTAITWTERMHIDSAGNVGIGATAPNYRVHLHENSSGSNYLQFTNTTTGSTNANGFIIGADGSEHVRLHNYYNSDMIFATNAAERMRITSAGEFLVGKTSSVLTTVGHTLFPSGIAYHTTSGQPGLYINRLASDGDLAVFYQASVNEGSISVSGTTVSYNGAHLSRWSQLPEGVVPFEIPRGTVMSLVDEMCVWEGEDNEQLTRSIPSTTPGDTNIAGVFQNYDDSDEGDDFYIAQTGDFVIRVKGNVPLGAFLESAGDGTARPQADQTHVLRSTIARATKGVVQASDEETLLPCLLMAC